MLLIGKGLEKGLGTCIDDNDGHQLSTRERERERSMHARCNDEKKKMHERLESV